MKGTTVTIVYSEPPERRQGWRMSIFATGRLIATADRAVIDRALASRAVGLGLNVERIIIDGSLSKDQVREFLQKVPPQRHADVLWIEQDGNGYLSLDMCNVGRTEVRVSREDIACYLATAGVVSPAERTDIGAVA